MAVKFLGATGTSIVGTAPEIGVPVRESLKPGDLLISFVVVQGFVGTVLTPPATWSVEPSPESIGDQIIFSAIHYVGDADEPSSYVFTYSVSKTIDVVMAAYRGVKQDVLFDPINYPFGYYAPGGSVGTANKQTGVASISTPVSGSSSFKAYSRALFFFGATHGSLTPKLSDPVPLAAIRQRVQAAKASAMLVDFLESPPHVSPISALSVVSSVTLTGSIGLVRVLEPLVEANDSYDTYAAKIMRNRLMPPAFDVTYGELTANVLTAIGGCVNDLGGRFGDEDFLPDEV